VEVDVPAERVEEHDVGMDRKIYQGGWSLQVISVIGLFV